MKTTLFNRRTLTSSYLVTASLMLSLSACDSTPNSSSQATDSTKSSASPALAMNQTYTKPEITINYYNQSLKIIFLNSPQSAKPRTWMHSMNGNMSNVGFTEDLQAIADAGIGGVLLFNVSHYIPKGNVLFNSEN